MHAVHMNAARLTVITWIDWDVDDFFFLNHWAKIFWPMRVYSASEQPRKEKDLGFFILWVILPFVMSQKASSPPTHAEAATDVQ